MKTFLFKLVSKLFEKERLEEINEATHIGQRLAAEQAWRSRTDNQIMELHTFIDEPVICISNEVQVPVIGFAKRVELITQAQSPVLVIWDYVSGEEKFIMGNTYRYTEQLFNLIFDSDINAIIALLYSARYSNIEVDKKPIGDFPFDKQLVIARLENSGFYQAVKTRKHKQNGKNKDV